MSPAAEATRPNLALRIAVALSVLGVIAMNALANALPLFGRSTGEVSARYPTLVTPAGYVFSIWGLIYLGLLAYSVAQFVRPLSEDPLPDRLAWALLASSVANVAWLLLWHSLRIYLTVPVMLVLLASLIAAYVIARRGRPEPPSVLERWAVRAPLGLYLGWISVATIANISTALVAAGWNGWGVPDTVWAALVIAIAAAIAIAGLVRERDLVFAGVFVWALVGISVETPERVVAVIAGVLAAAVALAMVVVPLVRRPRPR